MKHIKSVGIGIGGGADLFLSETNHLVLDIEQAGINLQISLSNGACSKERIDFIIECLNRLKIHAPESIRYGCD